MLIQTGASVSATGAVFDTTLIPKSVWMDGSADGFTRSASDFDNEDGKEFTLGTWFQLTEFGVTGALFCAGTSGGYTSLRHDDDNKIYFQTQVGDAILSTPNFYRDIGWYHLLLSVDTTQNVASNRVRLWISGEEVILSGTQPAKDRVYQFNTNQIHEVGDSYENGAFEGYLSQSFMIGSKSVQQGDFQISDFVDTFQVGTHGQSYIPKAHSEIKTLVDAGSDNSFLLDYNPADPTASNALGLDIGTHGNHFTSTDMGSANQSVNTPSKVYPIFNPLAQNSTGVTLTEGNTKVSRSSSGFGQVAASIGMSTGKWYCEVTVNDVSNIGLGIFEGQVFGTANRYVGQDSNGYEYSSLGTKVTGGSYSSYGDSFTNSDVIGILFDADDGKLYFSKNGTIQNSGDTANGTGFAFENLTNGPYFFAAGAESVSTANAWNFGQSSFAHTPPSGFQSLNSANLTAPDYHGVDYFDTTLYEGTGTGQRVGDFVPFTDAYTVDKSAMFQHDEVRYLSRTIETPSSPNGRKGTWSVWFKAANIDTDNIFFDTGTTATNRFSLQMDAGGNILFYHGSNKVIETKASFKGDGAWHNIVLKVDTELDPGESGATPNRAIMFIDGVQLASTDLDTFPTNTNIPEDAEIGYMDPSATQFVGSYNGATANQWDGYLTEVVFLDNQYLNASSFGQLDTSTNRWVPKDVSGLTFGDCGFYLEFKTSSLSNGTLIAQGTGTPIGNMTAGGGLAAAFDGDIENYNAGAQSNSTSGNIGKDWGSGVTKTVTGVAVKMLGNMTIDGGAADETMTLTVERSDNGTDFTQIYTQSGIVVGNGHTVTRRMGFSNTAAARYARVSVSHGGGAETHISELEFYENGSALGSDLGTDTSGNGNHFTMSNGVGSSGLPDDGIWETTDQSTDTPSKNYAVYNTVKGAVYTAMSMSEGNLTTKSGNGSVALAQGFPIQDGYWYYEVNLVEDVSNMVFGLYNPSTTVTASDSNPSLTGIRDTGIVSLIQNNGGSNSIGLSTSDTGLSNPSAGDVVGIYIRKVGDTYGMWFSLNGTAMNNTPAANATATADIDFSASIELVPAAHYSNAGTKEAQTNFGQLLQFDGGATSFNAASDGYWKHAPVTGFKALNRDNLDDTASKITALAWIKNRDADDNHSLFDRVRGVHQLKNIIAGDNTAPAAESTDATSVQRFLQRGVQIGSSSAINTANNSYVLWQWLVGDSATTGTVLSNGSDIDATVITADAGHFSVGTYSGTGSSSNFLHGLGGKPEFVAIYCRNEDTQPISTCSEYYSGSDYYMYLSYADAESNAGGTSLWPSDRTATAVPVGTNGTVNASGDTYGFIALRSIPGVCKIGQYVGNSSANGPYVSTGFKPRWVCLKNITTTSRNWVILDTERTPSNVTSPFCLLANKNDDDEAGTIGEFDMLSDGFRLKADSANANNTNDKYLYIALGSIGGNGSLPPVYGA